MSEQVRLGHLYPTSVPPGAKAIARTDLQQAAGSKSFQQVLDESTLKFSRHAEIRLQQRGIELKPEELAKIQTAVDKAAAKGARDSLLIMNELALIVNVRNRTVVTAMDGAQLKDNVFTQIDSAVVVS